MATKEELKARTDEARLTVTRRDGQEGEPLVSDYEHALAVHEGAVLPDEPTDPRAVVYEVTGPFPVFGVATGGTFTAEITPDGVIHHEGQSAHGEALLAQGAIQETEGGNTDG